MNGSVYYTPTVKEQNRRVNDFLRENRWSERLTGWSSTVGNIVKGTPWNGGYGYMPEGTWPLLSKFSAVAGKGVWQEYAAKLGATQQHLDKLTNAAALVSVVLIQQAKAEFQKIEGSAEYRAFGEFVMETYQRESQERYERERKEKADKEAAEQEALRLSRTAIPTEVQVTGDEDYELDTEAFDNFEDNLEEHRGERCKYCCDDEDNCWTVQDLYSEAKGSFETDVALVTLPLGELTVEEILKHLPNTSQEIADSGHKVDAALLQSKITKTTDGLFIAENETAHALSYEKRLRLGESYAVTDLVSTDNGELEEVEWPLFEVV